MAEKQFARSGAKGPDVFADDDPLAELARIVGFEPKPVAANTQRRDPSFVNIRPVEQLREPELEAAAPRPQHPIFNLEDELLREFEMFDTPRNDNTAPERDDSRLDVAPEAAEARAEEPVAVRREPVLTLDDQHVGAKPAPQAETFVESVEPEAVVVKPEQVETVAEVRQEPAVESRSYSFDPPFELDAPTERSAPVAQAQAAVDAFEFDLASELEMAVGRSVEAEPVAPAPVVEPPVIEEPVAVAEAVAPPQAPASAAPRFRSLATDFRMQRATPQPAAAVEPARPALEIAAAPVIESIARNVREESARASAQREPHFDEPAIEWDRLAEELTSVISEPDVPQMPQGGFRSAKDMSSDELLDDVSRFPVPESPAVAPSASLAPDVTAEPKSAATRFEKPSAEPQAANPADPAFEFDFDNIELELADMNFDEPPAVAPEPKPVRAPEPVAPQPVRAGFVPPLVMQAPAAPAPVAPTPIVSAPVAAAAAAAPVRQAPAAPPDDGELPFDPSLIADAEEHPEVVPHLDVPSLPSVEPEETIAPEPEYDLDIDAEMANLFAPIKPAEPEVAAPSSAAAASAVALDTKDPQRFENGKAAIDEFDEFERALEEDFRRAMGEPMADGDHAQPMILGPGMSYAQPETVRPRRLSRGLIVGVAAAVIGMAGLAGAYTLFFAPGGGSAGSSSTGPRVIAADKDPIKVVPENPGGKTVPNQDKAVYDRVAGNATEQPKQDSLLSSTEEPVDVVQRTLGPESLPMDNGEDAIANMQTPVGETEDARLLSDDEPAAAAKTDKPSANGSDPAVSPRKVRTMIVKADGTLVARETTEPAEATPAPVQAPKTNELKPALAAPAQPLQQDAQKPTDIASAIEASSDEQPAATNQNDPPLRTVRTTKVEAPAATPAAPAASAAPVPASRPADQPVNVVGTVTERGTVRKPAEAQPAAPEQQVASAATPGGYVMQIASLPSEAEAKKSYSSLSSKFGGLIGGRGYEIKKAEISGKGTFYRVRVPVGSKDAAAALCVKYRAAGGTCLVSK